MLVTSIAIGMLKKFRCKKGNYNEEYYDEGGCGYGKGMG